jgi:hypothetical protein
MADVADMLLQQGFKNASEVPDVAGAMTKGAQLAESINRIQMSRQQHDQQKQEIRDHKIKEVSDDLLKAKNLSGKALLGYKKFLANKIATYNVGDVFDPDTIEMVTSSPENLDRFGVIVDDVQNGHRTYAEGVELLKDQSKFYDVTPDMLKDLRKASEIATQDRNAMKVAEITAQRREQAAIAEDARKPDVEEGKKVSSLYTEWTNSGGDAGSVSRIKTLMNAREKLKNNEVILGDIRTNIPYGSDPAVMARINKKAKALSDDVQSTVNVKLLTGDPNPTGQQVSDVRSFALDPVLDNAANIKKLDAQIEKELRAQQNLKQLFVKHGKVKPGDNLDWKSKISSLKGKAQQLPKEEQKKFLDALSNKLNVPVGELRKELGI